MRVPFAMTRPTTTIVHVMEEGAFFHKTNEMIFDILRTIVSGDKVRLQEDGYDLDMTYITPRIIAMGLPGVNVEAAYRNNIQEVANFLNQKYNNHYRIINLCAEREYNTDLFNPGSVINKFGFPDHHNPPLELLKEICETMYAYLNENPVNVVVVHCLAGRGRTGTVIASYLTYSRLFDNGSEALEHFARKRSIVHKGVQQPSQRRYVQYFSEIVAGRQPKHYHKSLCLKQIIMYTIPKFGPNHTCQPVLEIYTSPTREKPKQLLYSSLRSRKNFDYRTNEPKCYSYKDGTMIFDISIELQGDIYMRCYHFTNKKLLSQMKPDEQYELLNRNEKHSTFNEKKKEVPGIFMFRVSFHTGFVPHPNHSNYSILRLTKTEIDDAIKSSKFDKDFFMDLVWEQIPEK